MVVGLLALAPALSAPPAAGDGNEAPGAPEVFRSITAGFDHSCGILPDGTVKCWGGNLDGQLGSEDTESRGDESAEMGGNLPVVDLGTGEQATALAASVNTTCALLDGGSVKCWGLNEHGQLGLGDTANRGDGPGDMGDALPAVDLGTGRTALSVSAGLHHACAVLEDGSVKCWGWNNHGQLGLGDTADRGDQPGEMGDALPTVALGTGRTATAVVAGDANTCAILDDGSVKCWGWNLYGQLGLGDTASRGDQPGEMGDALPAVPLGTGRTVTALTGADITSCALLDDGSVKCWGYNASGQLGLGTTTARGDHPGEMGDALPAVGLGTGRSADAITLGRSGFPCALLDDGDVACWGSNSSGSLGAGAAGDRGDEPGEMGDALPTVALGTGRTALAVTAGERHACAVLDDLTLKCWGENDEGQLGLGDDLNRGTIPSHMGDGLPTVDVIANPSVGVELVADQLQVFTGDPIDYHVLITNTGDTTLHGVTVDDPAAPDCEGPVADIGPGSSVTIDCTYLTVADDAGTYSNTATVDSDETDPVASNQVDVTVVRDRQPDAAIKKAGGTRVGDDVYGTDPTDPDQTVTVGRGRGGQVTFVTRVENDGDRASRYGLRRLGTDPGLTVRYFDGTTDITSAVVNRTYQTPSISPGSSRSIRVVVTVTNNASRQIPHLVTLRALSVAEHPQTDTVQGIVLVN